MSLLAKLPPLRRAGTAPARSEVLTLLQADFVVTLAHAAALGGVHLIVTSPPYCDARTYGAGVNWTLADYQRLGDAVKPALVPGGHCIMVLDAPVRKWREGFGTERGLVPWKVMLDWAERVGLRVPDRLAYGRQGQVGLFRGRFRNDWEPLLWFQRPGEAGYFDSLSIARPADWEYKVGRLKTTRSADGEYQTKRMHGTGEATRLGLKYPGTLWWYGVTGGIGHGRDDDFDHPARFCLPFAEDAVRCFCPPGGLVCDPFVGSGTSAVAALRHGRRFIGGDLLARPSDGKPWVEVARERVAEFALLKSTT